MSEEETVKAVTSRLEDSPREFMMYAEQTLYYSVCIHAYSLEEAQKKFDKLEFDYNYLDEEGETIHTKTTEYVTIDKKDADGVVSSGWVEETTLWERK